MSLTLRGCALPTMCRGILRPPRSAFPVDHQGRRRGRSSRSLSTHTSRSTLTFTNRDEVGHSWSDDSVISSSLWISRKMLDRSPRPTPSARGVPGDLRRGCVRALLSHRVLGVVEPALVGEQVSAPFVGERRLVPGEPIVGRARGGGVAGQGLSDRHRGDREAERTRDVGEHRRAVARRVLEPVVRETSRWAAIRARSASLTSRSTYAITVLSSRHSTRRGMLPRRRVAVVPPCHSQEWARPGELCAISASPPPGKRYPGWRELPDLRPRPRGRRARHGVHDVPQDAGRRSVGQRDR